MKPKVSTPSPTTPAPDPGQQVTASAQNASNDAAVQARMAGGLSSTMLTGPAGLAQTTTTAPKSLLGG